MAFRFPGPLYPIVDTTAAPGRSAIELAEAMLAAGICLLQLRVKEAPTRIFVELARAVKSATDRYNAQLIINDRTDIASIVNAAGVHLGQEDLPPGAARQFLGTNKVIGQSTHNVAQAEAALRMGGVDYLAFGPIFPTQNKDRPDPVQGIAGLQRIRQICSLPLVAIGGITSATLAQVMHAGVDAVAVIGAIAQADDPGAATRALLQSAQVVTARRSRLRS